jgi:hypothetical protein
MRKHGGRAVTAPAIVRERNLNDRMKGDPRVPAGDVMTLHACLYAAAILRKRGQMPDHAIEIEGRWAPDLRAVTFWRAGALVAAYRIPDRVMDFDPSSAAIEIREYP